MAQHIRIVAILHIIMGVLGLLASLAFFLGGAGFAAALSNEDRDAALAMGTCGTVVAVIIGIVSLPSIIAGVGLQKRKSWARVLTIILSVINLLNFPIGTAIGGYSLWALLNDQSRAYFSDHNNFAPPTI